MITNSDQTEIDPYAPFEQEAAECRALGIGLLVAIIAAVGFALTLLALRGCHQDRDTVPQPTYIETTHSHHHMIRATITPQAPSAASQILDGAREAEEKRREKLAAKKALTEPTAA